MHSSSCFGFAPLVRDLDFIHFMIPSRRYDCAVQYAVTLGNRSRSAFPSLAASLRAAGSLMRVNCEYTSRPLSSSARSSPASGFGSTFNFWTVFVVLCAPILGGVGNGGVNGAPLLFLRRSLVFKVENVLGTFVEVKPDVAVSI